MTADDIRKKSLGECGEPHFLREIAAQLATLNELLEGIVSGERGVFPVGVVADEPLPVKVKS